MSILIKDMEMPTSCGECELCACYVLEDGTEENYRCPITMYPIHDFDKRHERCPLIPVPPHGRLIDADALPQIKGKVHIVDIMVAPTIIEAEVTDDGEVR